MCARNNGKDISCILKFSLCINGIKVKCAFSLFCWLISKVFKQCKQVFNARVSPEKDLGVPLKTFLVNWSVSMISASELSKDIVHQL